ncbi:MAG: hypothetical protein M1830_010550 [Pleopsidium flavum]|nr:MAG: hypothetical protein M1830_010550 [Pleopsidium flavum]
MSIPPRSPSRRPALRNEESSSSLIGLEKVMPTAVPSFRTFQRSLPKLTNKDKPLPPVPRKPSSVYSSQHDDLIDSYFGLGPKDEVLPSEIYLQPVTYSSSTPQIALGDPSKLSAYQQLQQPLSAPLRLENHPAPTPPLKPAKEQSRDHIIPTQTPPNESLLPETIAQKTRLFDHIAVKRQFDLQRAEPPPRLQTPPGFKAFLYDAEYKQYPRPATERSTDLVDQSLVPPPLSLRKSQQSDEVESSHFSISSSDSDDEGLHTGIRDSVRAYARKALHLHKSSAEEKETKRVMSVASAKYPFMDPTSSSRRQSKFGSISTERRASIQQGITNMYDKISTWSPIPTTNKKRATIPREARSPAIPITPYQQLGRKAWEPAPKSPKSPKHKSPKAKNPYAILGTSRRAVKEPDTPYPHTAVPEQQDGKGSALQDRTNKPKFRRTASEKRRDDLKKKIVVVGAADQYPDGRVNHWM